MQKRRRKPTAAQLAAEERLRNTLVRAMSYIIQEDEATRVADKLRLHFGTFGATLRAPQSELEKVLGEKPGKFLKLCVDLAKAYMENNSSSMRYIVDPKCAEGIFRPLFLDKSEECVAIALLDTNQQLMFCDIVSEGGLAEAPLNVQKMITLALNYNARNIVLCHNHTSESVMPSDADVLSTSILFSAFRSVDIWLQDHIILTKDHMLSFEESGILAALVKEEQGTRSELINNARILIHDVGWQEQAVKKDD